MITSRHNEKLKLVRRLRRRRHREREGLFVTEGEDLLAAGRDSGAEPVLVLSEQGAGLGGIEVERSLLDEVSALGSGTRVLAVWRIAAAPPQGRVWVYLHGISDPRNVGAVIRSIHALVEGTVLLGPGCADLHSPKAVRATMGSIFDQPVVRGELADAPRPRVALVAHGGEALGGLIPPATICLGSERRGLPREILDACERRVTIPLRDGGAESLNVAAAAAIALERISSSASLAATREQPMSEAETAIRESAGA